MNRVRQCLFLLLLSHFPAYGLDTSFASGFQSGFSVKKDVRYDASLGLNWQWHLELRMGIDRNVFISIFGGLQGEDLMVTSTGVVYRAQEGTYGSLQAGLRFPLKDGLQWGLSAGPGIQFNRYTSSDLSFVSINAESQAWLSYFPDGKGFFLQAGLPLNWTFEPDLLIHFRSGLRLSIGWEGL